MHPAFSVVKSRGLLSQVVQTLVRKHCETGNVTAMKEIVAAVIVLNGMQSRDVPRNVGIKTQEILYIGMEALQRRVDDYHARGGVLTAKGYATTDQLLAEAEKQWLKGWSRQVDETIGLGTDKTEEEIRDKLTLVAQRLRDLIMETGVVEDVEDDIRITIKGSKLEGLCMRSARQMFEVFNFPNQAIHDATHRDRKT